MVRIKHRYLLLNFLYPEASTCTSKDAQLHALPNVVAFHSPTPDTLTVPVLIRALHERIEYLFGDYGAGKTSSGLKVMYISPATSTAIIRCSREHYRMVWAALTFMTQLPRAEKQGKAIPVVVQVVRVSGTIRKVEEAAVRRSRAMVARARRGERENSGGRRTIMEGIFWGHEGKQDEARDEEVYEGVESEGEESEYD